MEPDLRALVDQSVAWLPDSDLKRCLVDTLGWIDEGLAWPEIRALVMARHGRDDFTDVRHNTAFVLVGLLCGATFEERILITNNCGEDTDSSTATTGALLGIYDPAGIPERWLTPIGRALVLNDAVVDLDHPSDLEGFTDLVLGLGGRLDERVGPEEEAGFDPAARAIPVEMGFFNTLHEQWAGRDITGLPPEGGRCPEVAVEAARLPGTWVRLPAHEFADRLLMVRYRVNGHGVRSVRLQVNCTEDYRLWLNGAFLHAAQGTRLMFPSPHSTPVGQFVDCDLADGWHELTVVIRRPDDPDGVAEWVLALAERPSFLWVPDAFGPEDVTV